jgi:hypothetical protein
MKAVIGLFVCVLSLCLVPAVSAVTVDLSSPQEGTALAPGDTLELALTVTNDSNAPDLVVLVLDVQVGDGEPGNIPGISHKPIRIKLGPGQSVTKNLELVLPDYKKLLSGEYAITLSVEANGLLSQTQASDTIALLLVKP